MSAYAEVIGDPIRQSKSPAIHGFWLAALGLDGAYRAQCVATDELDAYFAARRIDADWRGCNVTMPHKQAVIALIDRLDPLAAETGAVNTVVREARQLIGYNTDVPGFLEPLPAMTADHRGHALVIGSGGAARAVIVALATAGYAITLAARDGAKARALLDALAPDAASVVVDLAALAAGGAGLCAPVDLVVNASALGMTGQAPLVFDLAHVPGALVYDIVTSPAETALLRAARAAGHATIDGLAMLIGQADYAFRRFFGCKPPRGAADRDLRARLMA